MISSSVNMPKQKGTKNSLINVEMKKYLFFCIVVQLVFKSTASSTTIEYTTMRVIYCTDGPRTCFFNLFPLFKPWVR